jgi:hypothetical protein
MLKSIQIDSKFVVFAVILGLLTFVGLSGNASATLAGENGPIVYVEEHEEQYECDEGQNLTLDTIEEEWECPTGDITQVITTDAEGQNPVVAAEFSEEDDEEATTATISPNDEDGSHEIIFGTEKRECVEMDVEWEPVDLSAVTEEQYCYFYNASAVIYRVQIDANGNPLGEPEVISTVTGSLEDVVYYDNYYIELSYAPDGTTVVGTRFYYAEHMNENDVVCFDECGDEYEGYGPNFVIETVDLKTGEITNLVGPKYDPFMNAGYGQNGNIYFTQSPMKKADWISHNKALVDDEEENYSSDVWYFTPGSTDAIQLTDTPDINEYFLSVSPDSKQVLVCDPYSEYMRFYLVDTATGEVVMIELDDSDSPFLPKFFAPNGEGYLGIKDFKAFYGICGTRVTASRALAVALDQAEEENDRGVAFAALDDFQNAVVYNNMQNPDDWAPIVAYTNETPEEEPQVLAEVTTSSPVLQSTGASIWTTLAVGSLVTTTAGATATRRKEK